MIRCIEEAILAVDSLRLPLVLRRILTNELLPDSIRYYCEAPRVYFVLVNEYPGNMPFEENLVPLWEPNGDHIIAYVGGEKPFYLSYYFEDGPNDFKTLGFSYQAFLIHLFVREWELERSADELRELANLFEFRHLRELVQVLEKFNGSEWDHRRQAIADFHQQIEEIEKSACR